MAISGVSMTVKRTGHWASHGVGTNVNESGNFTSYASDICTVTISNTNSSAVIITSIKLPVGTGKGTVYGEVWKNGVKTIDAFTVTGAACAAKIINSSNKSLFSANVTTNVTVSKTGSTSASGYFNNPSGGTTFTGSLTLAKNSSITLGVGVNGGSGSTSGPILSCDNGYSDGDNDNKQISRNIDINGSIATCSIASVTLSDTTVLNGEEITATANSVSPSDANIAYDWYNSSGTWLSSGNKRKPTSDKEYCIATITKSGYKDATATSSKITYYTRPAKPSNLTITDSNSDGRTTDRDDYEFKWNTVSNGTNNKVTGYTYNIYVSGTSKKSGTITSNSVTFSATELGLAKGASLYFTVKTEGEHYDSDGAATSSTVNIVSSAVMQVKTSTGWKEGIVYINKGTNNKPDWVEATEVRIKNGSTWEFGT